MAKRTQLLMCGILGLCVLCGSACIRFGFSWPEVGEPLDQAACTMRIVEEAEWATVTAEILTITGLPVELRNGQSVEVNGQVLSPAEPAGRYSAVIPVAGAYAVTVTEPTRGVQTTNQAAPADFAIISPAAGGPASLSGFTLDWSNPSPDLQVTIALVQTLFGQERRKGIAAFADSGSKVFTALDLADFRQGAELSIAVTKVGSRSSIAGFRAGELSVERSRTAVATPQP